ncbi:helicase-exonuclease AddAB subunit AddB [Cohnella thailandensis]|uniref:Helicase-exonuclease AddAB subunit AddB n=1 Tax=Cohnella thailandensis TaxID=557557 RepID=A0A841T1E5_9BACL|nr:helicase-exonuclease AddAB subunit AddB [Cohnella thailandensis]MBB6636218.1 helicase-exonuclease AddAB subunit AddB [Cohnella thailandensis]MBP1973813.1 ATP-dependent helicase/nuclease subunit B [Cohnella thailandensis]
MTLRLITGRSGSGKTRACLDEIRERLKENPDGPPLLLIVPEQATFQAESAMVATKGLHGFLRAQVLSFRRLAFRVMQETGGLANIPINENGKAMLIHKALQRRRSELRLFRSGASAGGLVSKLGDLFTEWKRYGNDSGKLLESTRAEGSFALDEAPLLEDKLHDLTLLYRELEKELAGKWMDGEDALARLVEGAANAPLLEGAEVWLDGFHGFTETEYEVVGALLRRTKRVSAALCLDRPYEAGERPGELELFHPTATTSARLCELAEQSGVAIEAPLVLKPPVLPRFAGSLVLAHLELSYGERLAWNGDRRLLQPDGALSVHAAANRRAEAEAVARDMLRRRRAGEVRWRDMAVFVRNIEDYADLLGQVFSDYEIPYFLDGKAAVAHHPLVEFVRSALETVLSGWKSDPLFRCAKTDLLRQAGEAVTREDVDKLENYVLSAGIEGWRWHDDRVWRPLSGSDLEAEEQGGGETQMERLIKIRDALLAPLRRMEQKLKKAATVTELCVALFELLEETEAADRLERWSAQDEAAGQPGKARMHRPLWDGVMELLDQLVEMTGEERPDLPLFVGMVDAGLEQLKLGAVPPALDGVLIGSPERTRSDRICVLYLLGANDGVMPQTIRENGLLSEEERERLGDSGVRMAPGAKRRLLDERFLAYWTLTTPTRHLWISYPMANEEGQSLHPSEIIRHLRKRFPGLPVGSLSAEPVAGDPDSKQLEFAVYPGRSLTYLVSAFRHWRQGGELAPGWWSVYRWLSEREEWRPKLGKLLSSLLYRNDEEPLTKETSRLLYGDRLLASVSRMERFVSCPFRHFSSHGLRLRERRLYRIDAPDIGQLFHAALRQTTERLFAEGPAAMDMARWQSEAAAAVERLLPKVQSQILLSSHRHQAMARKLRDIVSRASAMLGEQAKWSAFRPVGLEVDFGPTGTLPPLSLDLGNDRWMDIAGRIDRVDAAPSQDGVLLRIMDYKSGAVKLKLDEIAYGLSLQMLTYLDVVVSHAPSWLGLQASPAGVLYFHVHNPLIHTLNGLSRGDADQAMRKEFRMQGLVLADGDAVTLMDESLADGGKSTIVPVEFKKDGSFSSRSQVADERQWGVLRRSVRKSIKTIGKRIVEGDVSIAPYRLDKRSPCQMCEFRPVCQFDGQMEGNSLRQLPKPGSKEQAWQWLEGNGAAEEEGGRT